MMANTVNTLPRLDYNLLKLNSAKLLINCVTLLMMTLFVLPINGSHKSIYVDNSSYKDIVIAFDPNISPTLISTLLDNVQEKFQQVSDNLYFATNQSLCFDEIVLVIPEQWESKIGSRRLNFTRSFTSLDTDIYIHSSGEMFNEEPYTDQYGQCGSPGRMIHLSKDMILEKENGGNKKSNAILHEWAHYRYGVFDERGFQNDKFHPHYTSDPSSDRLLMTSCASNDQGEILDISVSSYSPGFDCFSRQISDTFPPTNSCGLSVPQSTIVSSLMFSPRISSVNKFCTEETHDAFSPTKQNRLCDGKSVAEVIRTHPDFRKSIPNGPKCMTKFTITMEKRPRIAVFLDIIQGYNDRMILEPIRNLLDDYNPLLFELKENEAIIPPPRPIIKGHRENESVCFDCAMEQLRGNVKNVDQSVTHLYMITAGHYKEDRFPLESYAKELKSYDIKLKIIIYPYKPEANYSSLIRFAKAANAELTVIPHIDQKLSGATYNQFQFLETLGFQRDSLNPSELVLLAKNTSISSQSFVFTFNVDQSLIAANYTIKIILICHEKDECTRRVSQRIRINDEDKDYPGEEYLFISTSYAVRVVPERRDDGIWSVEWSGLDESKLTFMAAYAVAPKKNSNNKKQSMPVINNNFFSGSCWLSDSRPIIFLTSRDRLYGYVSLTRKIYEYVNNASVTLQIYDEIGGLVSSLPMVDDGLGDPDITRGDGIWSSLLHDLPTRRYLRAEVIVNSPRFILYPGLMDRPCCGSSVPEQAVLQRYNYLDRIISCGTFYIDDKISAKFDRTQRVFDLTASVLEGSESVVKIEFSLPEGIESIENIKMFNWTERSFIRTAFEAYGVRLSSVFERGLDKFSKEYEIPKGAASVPGIYYIAVQLMDSSGARSLSNLVGIYLNGEPDLPSDQPDSMIHSSDSRDFLDYINSAAIGNGVSSGSSLSGRSGLLGIWQITSIVVASFLFIFILLLFIICLVAGRKRRGGGRGSRSSGSGSITSKEESKKKLPPGSLGTDNPDKSVYRSYSDNLMGVKGDEIREIGSLHQHHNLNQVHHLHHPHVGLNNHHSSSDHHLTATHQQSPSPTHHQPTYQLTNQQPVLDNVKGISPVDSIPADKLLNHYDKVQQAKLRKEPLPVMRIEDITDVGSVHNTSSLSDNNSRFRGSMTGLPDDPFVTMSNDLNSWRYPTPVDQYQYCYNSHANYVPNATTNNIIEWRNSYDGSETASDYDPRYGTVEKKVTAVSQV